MKALMLLLLVIFLLFGCATSDVQRTVEVKVPVATCPQPPDFHESLCPAVSDSSSTDEVLTSMLQCLALRIGDERALEAILDAYRNPAPEPAFH